MIKHRVRYLDSRFGRWMRSNGWAGVTLPIPLWGAVVVMWGPNASIMELRHEVLGHVPQVERMGSAWYLVRILYEYARWGHLDAPMEIEARRLANEAHNKESA